ncbi:hypothetical protein [Streptomyces cellulosae]|uniref:CopG family transcriptional regulator n=1 Tax=Streptomyces cellulosae TaxID=1968 RepID=A0ABW7Y6Y5_STRCE
MNESPPVPEDPPTVAPPVPLRTRRTRPLNVHTQYITVAGADGEALQRRQNQAILAILRWLVEHPDGGTP